MDGPNTRHKMVQDRRGGPGLRKRGGIQKGNQRALRERGSQKMNGDGYNRSREMRAMRAEGVRDHSGGAPIHGRSRRKSSRPARPTRPARPKRSGQCDAGRKHDLQERDHDPASHQERVTACGSNRSKPALRAGLCEAPARGDPCDRTLDGLPVAVGSEARIRCDGRRP